MNQVSRFMPIISMSIFIVVHYKEDKLSPSACEKYIFMYFYTYYCNKALIYSIDLPLVGCLHSVIVQGTKKGFFNRFFYYYFLVKNV